MQLGSGRELILEAFLLVHLALKDEIGVMLSLKDPIPCGLRSRLVYKFSCAGCSACYVGET